MAEVLRSRRLLPALFAVLVIVTVSWASERPNVEASQRQGSAELGAVPREVLTFYYPWYGTVDGPGGAGRTVHWGHIDAAGKDIEASTDYPQLGPYDSHDPKVIDQHCRWAKDAGIDALIVSWWGHGDYTDRAMGPILDGCQRHGLSACIYYETVPRPRTARSAADDIIKVLDKYGEHPAHLRVDGKPVVFIYGRTLQELGLTEWLDVLKLIKAGYKGSVVAIGDQFSYGAARVFDGVHTYNTAGQLRGREPEEARAWASQTYRSWVELADRAGRISAVTVIPGYDDTKIRKPGLAVKRYDGELYRVQWQEAIKADPHWILTTSFNEWHEGSEIEPSLEYGRQYLDLTAEYAKGFKDRPNPHPLGSPMSGRADTSAKVPSAEEVSRLREKFAATRIGVLPGADSMGFWWLLDVGIGVELLTWEKVVTGELTAQRYPVLLYCAGEHCRRTVHAAGDVDDALARYLRQGGFLVVLPSLPWPFYYDESDRAVNRGGQFGISLRMGWESPPQGGGLGFIQPKRYLPHVPDRFALPESGDLRWRPFFAADGAKHTSLLQLCDAAGRHLGDAVAYSELHDGGRVLYVCFNLLEGPFAEVLLYDVFDFISTRLGW